MFKWRDILERALWTLIQGFVSAWPIGMGFTDFGALKVLACGAMMAGIAAVLSMLKTMALQWFEAHPRS